MHCLMYIKDSNVYLMLASITEAALLHNDSLQIYIHLLVMNASY